MKAIPLATSGIEIINPGYRKPGLNLQGAIRTLPLNRPEHINNKRMPGVIELIPEPAISQDEQQQMYAYRLGRIRSAMAQHNIALAVLTSPVSMRYATDFDEYQLFQSHIPTVVLFVPAEGPVTLFGASQRHYPGVEAYEKSHFATPFDGGLDLRPQCHNLVQDIERFMMEYAGGDKTARIALERMSPLVSQELVSKGYQLLDGEALTESAKLIKSDTELKYIRHSIAVAEYGIDLMHQALRPGITENQLWSVMHQVNIAHGGSWIEGNMLASGPRTNPWLQEACHRVIEQGDMVAFDTDMIGPGGYLADISRSWICGGGKGTQAQRDAYRHAYDEVHFNMSLIKPGVSFAELSDKAFPRQPQYQEQRYVCAFHGSGMSDEYPKIYYQEDWQDNGFDGELKENMVLCVESYSGAKGGHDGVKLEEMVRVTVTGYEKLSAYPYEALLLSGTG